MSHVLVDRERCVGSGSCEALAPDLFDVDVEGYAQVLIAGDLPADLEAKAALAAANCPEGAIIVEEEGS